MFLIFLRAVQLRSYLRCALKKEQLHPIRRDIGFDTDLRAPRRGSSVALVDSDGGRIHFGPAAGRPSVRVREASNPLQKLIPQSRNSQGDRLVDRVRRESPPYQSISNENDLYLDGFAWARVGSFVNPRRSGNLYQLLRVQRGLK